MRKPMPSVNEELDFWFKHDPETNTFVLLFTSPSDQHLIKMYFSEELFEKFLDESMAFFITTMNTDREETDEDST